VQKIKIKKEYHQLLKKEGLVSQAMTKRNHKDRNFRDYEKEMPKVEHRLEVEDMLLQDEEEDGDREDEARAASTDSKYRSLERYSKTAAKGGDNPSSDEESDDEDNGDGREAKKAGHGPRLGAVKKGAKDEKQ